MAGICEEKSIKGYGIFKCGNEPFFYSISYYKKYKRYSADSDGYSSYAETSLYAPIIGIGGIIKVYQTGAGMEWIIALAVVVILGFVMLLVSIAMPKFKIMQTLVDGLNLVSREILTGLSVIRAFGREKTEEERFDEANKKLTGTQLFTNRIMTFMMPGMMFIMYSVTILITWVSAQKLMRVRYRLVR